MRASFMRTLSGGVMPWWHGNGINQSVDAMLHFQGMVVALIPNEAPQVDEVLVCQGYDEQAIVRWLQKGYDTSPLIAQARQHGTATMHRSQDPKPFGPLASYEHIMAQMMPACPSNRRWWLVLCGRDDRPFGDNDQELASLLLRVWQVDFDHCGEPGMGRVLVGHDDRVIHADPKTLVHALEYPRMLADLLEQMHPIVKQRWPDLQNDQIHDFATDLAGTTWWVRFLKRQSVRQPDATSWYVEMRHFTDELMPAVGLVPDHRIALALAYLHDNYESSPSLADVARAVHVSPFHFHRIFTKQVGISPKQYLQRKQLQMAKWKLRSSSEPIGQVARHTGFASHGHFTSTFHRMIGVSPSEYRENGDHDHGTQSSVLEN